MKKAAISIHFSPRHIALFGTIICFLLAAASRLSAQGDLLVFPKRVVFEEGKKSAEINLSNIGHDSAKYMVSFVQVRMNEDGSFTNISVPDPGQFFADSFIRYYPHTVTLAPNESQTIKLQLKKTGKMLPGEYRSHLYLRAVPTNKTVEDKAVNNDANSLSIKLIPVYGITIATIIRVGANESHVSLSGLSLEYNRDSVPVARIEFSRTGNMSVYGNVTVNYIAATGEKTVVAAASGVAVYTPGTRRVLRMNLEQREGIDYTTGKIQVIYSTPTGTSGITLAEKELAFF